MCVCVRRLRLDLLVFSVTLFVGDEKIPASLHCLLMDNVVVDVYYVIIEELHIFRCVL